MGALSTGDDHPSITWEAVGVALTAWETMESSLARLYSIFVGKPNQLDAYEEFGREGRIYVERLSTLEKAAERYFIPNCCQDAEGELSEIVREAKSLAIHRHKIAHGIRADIPVYDPKHADKDGVVWPKLKSFLMPPYYSRERLRFEEFAIDSKIIYEYVGKFAELNVKITNLIMRVSPPQ